MGPVVGYGPAKPLALPVHGVRAVGHGAFITAGETVSISGNTFGSWLSLNCFASARYWN